MKQLLTTLAVITTLMLACKKDKKELASLSTTAATNVTANSIATGGNITSDGHSAISKRGIAWATHASPTVGDSITSDGAGAGSFTSNLTGLSANTTYYLRAYAINESGTAYGNEVSVKTAAGAPTITTAAVSNIQPLSAVTGGNITNDGGASVTERGVVYATTANPTINNYKITAGSGTGNFTATLQPLASQQTYYARAYATNSYGTAYGNQVQFNAASANTVTDIDGNVYPYVTIGTQSWMASNLKVTHYNNGDPITNGVTGFDWNSSTTGAYTFPSGIASKKDTFGLLYNVYAMSDTRNICPTGWHVPSDDEWKTLEMNQGMTQTQADSVGYRGTIAPNLREGGSSGLNLQLPGYLFPTSGSYSSVGTRGYFWTSTLGVPNQPNNGAWLRAVTNPTDANQLAVRRVVNVYGSSIRCVKN